MCCSCNLYKYFVIFSRLFSLKWKGTAKLFSWRFVFTKGQLEKIGNNFVKLVPIQTLIVRYLTFMLTKNTIGAQLLLTCKSIGKQVFCYLTKLHHLRSRYRIIFRLLIKPGTHPNLALGVSVPFPVNTYISLSMVNTLHLSC